MIAEAHYSLQAECLQNEIFRGIVCDAIWIGRGYDASSYVPFIVIHAVIIATGWWFLRQAER